MLPSRSLSSPTRLALLFSPRTKTKSERYPPLRYGTNKSFQMTYTYIAPLYRRVFSKAAVNYERKDFAPFQTVFSLSSIFRAISRWADKRAKGGPNEGRRGNGPPLLPLRLAIHELRPSWSREKIAYVWGSPTPYPPA